MDRFGNAEHLGALLVALNDPDWLVRSNAGWALVHLGPGVRPQVEAFARSCVNEEAREMALLVLSAGVREDWPRLIGARPREDFLRLIGTGRR